MACLRLILVFCSRPSGLRLHAHACRCRPDCHACRDAAGYGFAEVHFHKPPCSCLTGEACTQAAQSGDLKLLKVLRRLEPPCPWNAGVTRAAVSQGDTAMLRWELSAQCPFDLADAQVAPLMVVACGQVQLLQQMWPVQADFQKMLLQAAENGHLTMLEWLLSQQPKDRPELDVDVSVFGGLLDKADQQHMNVMTAAAVNGHLHVLEFLIGHRAPALRGIIRMPWNAFENIHGQCLPRLAKTGCHMYFPDRKRSITLMDLKCFIVSLVRWASRVDLAGALASRHAAVYLHQAGNQLLAQLTRLPDALVDRIAAKSLKQVVLADEREKATMLALMKKIQSLPFLF